ncbi:hypothetical protein V2J09_021858 [Rumex salicifolius]
MGVDTNPPAIAAFSMTPLPAVSWSLAMAATFSFLCLCIEVLHDLNDIGGARLEENGVCKEME